MFLGPNTEVDVIAIIAQKFVNKSICGTIVYQHFHRQNHRKCS